jgi:hypothetical protein
MSLQTDTHWTTVLNRSLTWWVTNSPLTLQSFGLFRSSNVFCFIPRRQNFLKSGQNGKYEWITYVHSILVPLYSTTNFTFSSCPDLRFFCKESVFSDYNALLHWGCKEGFATNWFSPHLVWASWCHRAAWRSVSSSVASLACPVQAPMGHMALSQDVPSFPV